MHPTSVLAHGAFAELANWNGVAERLHAAYPADIATLILWGARATGPRR